uniref:Defensin, beta-like 2 n=2 Tax=Ovalentaria TaxID=1489908 RepID=A0A3Q1F8Z5_9TELE
MSLILKMQLFIATSKSVFISDIEISTGEDPEMQYWTCGYRGLCRRFCHAQEYIVGHHGCPRRYRCCAMRS